MGARSRKRIVRLEVIRLYSEMSKMTSPECQNVCRRGKESENRCCESYYCEIAIAHTKKKWGIELVPTGHPKLPLMGPTGCVAAPHLRPICTVHTCEINDIGVKPGDKGWTDRYFRIRDRIDELDSTISLADL